MCPFLCQSIGHPLRGEKALNFYSERLRFGPNTRLFSWPLVFSDVLEMEGYKQVIERLRATFRSNMTVPLHFRRTQLEALLSLLEDNEPQILEALHKDLTKVHAHACTPHLHFPMAALTHQNRLLCFCSPSSSQCYLKSTWWPTSCIITSATWNPGCSRATWTKTW